MPNFGDDVSKIVIVNSLFVTIGMRNEYQVVRVSVSDLEAFLKFWDS